MTDTGYTLTNERPWPKSDGSATSSEAPVSESQNENTSPQIAPFEPFDAGDWEGVSIERRRWLVLNRIPWGEPGIMSGDGGTGKTKLMLQLAVAEAAELPDWVGGIVETHGPVIVYSGEEKLKEMHRRCADILAHRKLTFDRVKGRLRFICDEDEVVLATTDEHKGIVTPTRSLLRLEKTVQLIKPALVIIENAADVYAGNESNRALVTRFVRKHLGSLGQASQAAIALIQHPSVSGLNDGSGRSGSTAWNNAGRWRLNLTNAGRDGHPGLRDLEVVKSNYGPSGEKVRLQWERGVFVPEGMASPAERAAADAPADDAFLNCLRAALDQGLRVGPSPSVIWAPKVFEKMPEARGLRAKELDKAMRRLLPAKRIVIETSGPPSRQRQRIVLPQLSQNTGNGQT
jgi:RecA-family ATPase